MSVPRVVVYDGNPFDGMSAYGPFHERSAAEAWARDHLKSGEWFLSELTDPRDIEPIGAGEVSY